MKQYEVVLVNLDPTVGSEIQKTRPCLIISPNEMNEHIRTVIVAPLTSADKSYPSRVKVQDDSFVALEQIRCIDKSRIVKKLYTIEKTVIFKVKAVIKEMLVD